MKILVCGDRNWTEAGPIEQLVSALPAGSIVVEGEARGVDSMARDIARVAGFEVRRYPAKWDRYGRQAGRIRNLEMLNTEGPDIVVAFHDNIQASRGTGHMVRCSALRGKPVVVLNSRGRIYVSHNTGAQSLSDLFS